MSDVEEALRRAIDRGGPPARLLELFHRVLCREVVDGNPGLAPGEQERLREHYPIINQPDRYPRALVRRIYADRRAPMVQAVREAGSRRSGARKAEEPVRVFDAGCGYGTESFLFAALGAEVVAVDLDPVKIAIAQRRVAHFEKLLDRALPVDFRAADLDRHTPSPDRPLALTWMGSVLANLTDQDRFVAAVARASAPGGRLIVSDMNLLNPLFLLGEWRRRRRAAASGRFPGLTGDGLGSRFRDFLRMMGRRGRPGARYLEADRSKTPAPVRPATLGEDCFDDAQFFRVGTLLRLLRSHGFSRGRTLHSGFVPPVLGGLGLASLERLFARSPVLRHCGYFYTVEGVRVAGASGPGPADSTDRRRA